MRRTIMTLTAVLAATLVLGACVPITINVNFPQQKIESAASSIEDMVRTPPPPAAPSAPAPPAAPGQAPGGGQGSGARQRRFAPTAAAYPTPAPPSADGMVSVVRHGGGVVSIFIPRAAEAQVPELKTQTPEVMAAVGSRRQRFAQLSEAMAQGCIGENNQGLVEARPGTSCPASVGALVSGENRDRMVIYRTLIEQNNMPPGDLARVQQAFAKTNRERAAPGTWVQNPDGQWTRR